MPKSKLRNVNSALQHASNARQQFFDAVSPDHNFCVANDLKNFVGRTQKVLGQSDQERTHTSSHEAKMCQYSNPISTDTHRGVSEPTPNAAKRLYKSYTITRTVKQLSRPMSESQVKSALSSVQKRIQRVEGLSHPSTVPTAGLPRPIPTIPRLLYELRDVPIPLAQKELGPKVERSRSAVRSV